MSRKTTKEYRVHINEFLGCMGHEKNSYLYFDTLEEALACANKVKESDSSGWTQCYVQKRITKTIQVNHWEDFE